MTKPSFKTSNNHLGAEKLSCLSILHCTIKKNDIKITNKKTVKNQLPIFSLPRTTIQLLRLSTVSPGHCKISTSEHCELRHDPPIHTCLWKCLWNFGLLNQRNQHATRKNQFASCSQTMRKGGNHIKKSKHILQQGSLILSFETSEWYYDLPLWPVTV